MTSRRPVVAGMFYPLGKGSLDGMLSKLFEGIENRRLSCVISPHAGFEYSGKTAAWAASSLKPAKTFIILGPNHNVIGAEFSMMASGGWETPLGVVKIDPELANELKKCGVLEEDALAHVHEHSIEVQLPFLQHRFKKFGLVPISITNIDYSTEFLEKCVVLGKHISKTIKDKSVGIVASSDFSHYLPAKTADAKDAEAIEKIARLDVKGLFDSLERTNASVCGYGPIAVAMSAAKAMGLKEAKVINHTNSGDATGDYSSVVSYYAIGFE